MATKTVRGRYDHEVGEQVEGCTILEKRVVIPPDPQERRLGVYDFLVEAKLEVEKPRTRRAAHAAPAVAVATPQGSFTRTTPAEMNGAVIRRIPSR